MSLVFADSFFYLALLNRRDAAHSLASQFAARRGIRTLTTEWVLTEVADAFSESNKRGSIKPFVEHLQTNPTVEIVPASPELFARGLELYAQRLDKGWSLTDCISFTVMEARGLSEAATGDQHFVQAGFKALLT